MACSARTLSMPPAGPWERQFFWMMQLPPAAFNPLQNLAALSADAKGPTRVR
jgi:hypothetical protein